MNTLLKLSESNIIKLDKVSDIFNPETEQKILNRFNQEFKHKITDNLMRTCFGKILGKKAWSEMSNEEKKKEILERVKEDFSVARQEIKSRNPVDYLLDRALDPLDPMNVIYRLLLKSLGAEIIDDKNFGGRIKLPDNLQRMLDKKEKKLELK